MLTAACFFATSCTVVTLTGSWRSKGAPEHRPENLLVVYPAKGNRVSVLFEDALVAELHEHGIKALPGHSVLPQDRLFDREYLEKAVRRIGADGVVTCRMLRGETRTAVEPGERYPGVWNASQFPYMNIYGYYGTLNADEPPTVVAYRVETFQVNLFSVPNGRLLWSGILKTADPENIRSVSRDLAKIVVERLIEEKLVRSE